MSLGRVQIQADDVGGLVFEIGIIAGHVPLQPMRLQAGFFPDPMHSVLADIQLRGQLAAAPVRGTVLRLPAGSRENPRPQLRSEHRSWLPGMAGIQSVDAGSEEPLLPADDGRSGGPQPPLNGAERGTLGQHQDQTGAEDISGRQRTRLGDAAELALLTLGENYGIAGHTPLDVSGPTNVISATGH